MKKIFALSITSTLLLSSAAAAQAPAAPFSIDMLEPPAQGVLVGQPARRFMSRELMVEMAVAALDACKKRGGPSAVAVADAQGVERLFIGDEGARFVTLGAARKKAQMVSKTSRATAATVNDPAYQQKVRDVIGDDAVNVSGGQPIMVGNEMLGAIAVGGRGAAEENWCAFQGIKKIQARLK